MILGYTCPGCGETCSTPVEAGNHCAPQILTVPNLSLRDWFAGQALNAQIVALSGVGEWNPAQCAALAYEFADAMLTERNEP